MHLIGARAIDDNMTICHLCVLIICWICWMHLIGARAIDGNMTICHDIYLCSGTLGKQATIERLVCMLPKVQPETIISTNVPKKMKNCVL